MSILEVKNLKKNFGSLEVLKGIDFSLEKGEALAMIRKWKDNTFALPELFRAPDTWTDYCK